MANENLGNQATQFGHQDSRVQTHSKDAGPEAEPRSSASSSDKTSIADGARDLVDQARDGAASIAAKTSNLASDGVDAVTGYAKDSGKQITEQIRQRPTEALLIAGFVGLVLGIALAR